MLRYGNISKICVALFTLKLVYIYNTPKPQNPKTPKPQNPVSVLLAFVEKRKYIV